MAEVYELAWFLCARQLLTKEANGGGSGRNNLRATKYHSSPSVSFGERKTMALVFVMACVGV